MVKTLEGIRVVDFTLAGAGPSCGRLLREAGADCVLVEPPSGNVTRMLNTFDYYTTGKRCLTLNAKTPEGQEILHRLLKQADVFLSNYRMKGLRKLGLSYEDVSRINPTIIYATLDGFGRHGPSADHPGYDPTAFWARGGMLKDFAERSAQTLFPPPIAVGDISTGMALYGGICAALFRRFRTGKGMQVYSSLLQTALYLNHDAVIGSQYGEEFPKSRFAPRWGLVNTYQCKDGQWIGMDCMSLEKALALLEALGLDSKEARIRWQTYEDTMYDGAPDLVATLDRLFAAVTQDEAMQILRRIDIAAERVQSTQESIHDPQAAANQYVYEAVDRTGKRMLYPSSPVKYGNDTCPEALPGPRLGEHSIRILSELGYSKEEIDVFIEKGVTTDDPTGPKVAASALHG